MNKVTQLPIDQPNTGGRTRGQSGQTPETAVSGNVGGDLRAARLRRGDDLVAVSRALRIRQDHLDAIEEGRQDDLPGRTYAVGFVRSYADYLGLNSAEYVERIKAEIGGRGEQSPLRGLPEDTGESGLPYGWVFMGLVVLCVVGYAGYHLVRSAEFTTAQQPVAPVPAVMTAESARHAPTPRRAAHTPAQQKAAPGSNASAATANANPVAAAAGSGANPVPPSAPAASGSPDAALAALPAGQVYGTQNRNARVILHARTATHVLVEGPGGKVYINRILHPGDAYRVPDLVGLSLTTPDGGAVLLELDGQDMGVAGQSGQLTETLSLDPQAIVDRAHGGSPG